jgi:predicted ester cyclase
MTTHSPAERALDSHNAEHQGTTVSGPNSRIARQIVDTFVTGETSALEDLVALDALDHTSPKQSAGGRAGLIEGISFYRATFADLDVTVEQELEAGDLVAIFGRINGVHSGDALGIPATGKQVSFPYIDIFRIADGQMVEAWHLEDIAGLLRQVGALPG